MQANGSPPAQEQQAPAPPERRQYRGVRQRRWGRWVAEIRLPNTRKQIWLGSYDAPEKAARAFDAASVCLRGPDAAGGLNFPGSPPAVVRRTSDPQEVYAAAVAHANRAAAGAGAIAAAPEEATTTMTDEPTTTSDRGVPPAPLQVFTGSFDWSHALAEPIYSPVATGSHSYVRAGSFDWSPALAEPIYSPVATGSHSYVRVSPTAAAADVETEENGSAWCTALWDFDSASTSSTRH